MPRPMILECLGPISLFLAATGRKVIEDFLLFFEHIFAPALVLLNFFAQPRHIFRPHVGGAALHLVRVAELVVASGLVLSIFVLFC